jgi:Flp pilus assembly protein TadG
MRCSVPKSTRRPTQRGGVALIFALMLVPLMAFMGLAADLGRIYINKSELQGAADACALAAAMHLNGTPSGTAFSAATNSGKHIAILNSSNLQATAITSGSVTVEFSAALSGASWATSAAGPASGASYARCTIRRTSIPTWFLQVAGMHYFQISALGVARFLPTGSTNCGFSSGACNQAPSLVF